MVFNYFKPLNISDITCLHMFVNVFFGMCNVIRTGNELERATLGDNYKSLIINSMSNWLFLS